MRGKLNIREIKNVWKTTHFPTLTLNINGFNAPIKRHRIANWIKNKTQSYVAYGKPISLRKTNTGLE
jgi:hypothetical protein